MSSIFIREPQLEDENAFILAMQHSQSLHHPWMKAPYTHEEYLDYIRRYQKPNMKTLLVLHPSNNIIGVFSLSEIVRGPFQNAALGFYATIDYAGQGYMSKGLKLVLEKAFNELALHRLEANIQSENLKSINLVRRCGFREEGTAVRYIKINDKWTDHERWAITLEDWLESSCNT